MKGKNPSNSRSTRHIENLVRFLQNQQANFNETWCKSSFCKRTSNKGLCTIYSKDTVIRKNGLWVNNPWQEFFKYDLPGELPDVVQIQVCYDRNGQFNLRKVFISGLWSPR
jgi:hypothetical protein